MSSVSPGKARLKVVFDTNIYISAFLKSGFSRELFDWAVQGKYEIFCSGSILSEIKEKLKTKFHVGKTDIELFISTVAKIAKVAETGQKLTIVQADPKDNIVLECAVSSGATLIITLDKHLLKLKNFQKIGIVHPKTFHWIMPDRYE